MSELLTGHAKAHTNIALIKYWGKADSNLILPTNDSISLTLDEFYTETSVKFRSDLKQNILTINQKQQPTDKLKRVNRIIKHFSDMWDGPKFAEITSDNHVPNSAGLASSASAMAALAGATMKATQTQLSLKELSSVARLGSGSATRSIFGNFVHWHRGHDHDSSYAEPLESPADFKINMLTVVINDQPKRISSTNGMSNTAQTSPFFKEWTNTANQAIDEMKQAIRFGNFSKIGEMAENNAMQMHATTLSSNPPFTYFEPDTLKVLQIIQQLRHDGIECYATIDAGPNVKIICQNNNLKQIKNSLLDEFNENQLIVAHMGPGIKIY
ncbi:diphosphomevalonate decarboxylase [Pediococcus argentinicus]|uniref:diphosphomevalonate decarboxylase n=1 Tax=Pediococcus argentinicus TaxID=480391 RepID=A0A0R2NKQ4_9LACO|nr:diphosphomevalonate decarboxylase [Pediococcus argentinicus]KRO26345.1 diphosphomevalonate decarboxylase [Pediococcus argentinicus]NKZ21463.1 diphosphomevalonate decarboxylase [Pediococcus argentinicus]GEP18738.1 diphosphomevalonate decarboxylase [Pediococcus argentinicus]